MGLLQAFIDLLTDKKNVQPTIATAVSDDGTADPSMASRMLNPLRVPA